MSKLSLEERTVGFILRAPLGDGKTSGSLTSEAVKPFLEKEEDFGSLVKDSYNQEGDKYKDLVERNPFVGNHNYSIVKNLINSCSKNGWDLNQAVVQDASNIIGSIYVNETHDDPEWRISPYGLISLFANLSLISEKLGSYEAVREEISKQVEHYQTLIGSAYEKHITNDETFPATKMHTNLTKNLEKIPAEDKEIHKKMMRSNEKAFQSFMTFQLIDVYQELADLPKVLSLDFCKELCGDPVKGEKNIYFVPDINQGDLHNINVITSVKMEDLKSYVSKYGFCFDRR
ncbi:hypothetical protein HON71_02835 [Candidatus Woesearchaeota archaeon]|jgi:hypothetical protein|nr:hypothetical protein [Candidatus Woesearchaeota archaeon]MBT5342194.1 hypothetical protein [Candidatus Woesearchaeota archaeon]